MSASRLSEHLSRSFHASGSLHAEVTVFIHETPNAVAILRDVVWIPNRFVVLTNLKALQNPKAQGIPPSNNSVMSEQNDHQEAKTFSQKWTRGLQKFTKPMLRPILGMSSHAAKNPKSYVISIIVMSCALMALGLFTNFTEETSDDIWSPAGSKTVEHYDWVENDSNFPKSQRSVVIIVHRDGNNLFGEDEGDNSLALESTKRMFEALDQLRATDRYDELCAYSTYISPITNETTCQIVGASTFWNESTAAFEASVTSDEEALAAMSAEFYPSGSKVDFDQIIGYNKFDDNGMLNFGKTFVVVVLLPPDDEDDSSGAFSKDFEEDALDRILALQDKWNADSGNGFKLEVIADRSFEDEFTRALTKGESTT